MRKKLLTIGNKLRIVGGEVGEGVGLALFNR